MAKYAFGIYGTPGLKYGQTDADRLYYSSTIKTWSFNYGSISVLWKAVSADPVAILAGELLTHWRLTKNFSGTPDNPYAGTVLLSGPTSEFVTSYVDTSSDLSIENKEVTYTLWIFSTLVGWVNTGSSSVNAVVDTTTQRYFKSWLPAVWVNETLGVGDAVGEYEESGFTAVLDAYGFEYDKIKTQAELLYNSLDASKIPSKLLKNKITDLGFIYEPTLGDTYHRTLYRTGNLINSAKGTSLAIKTYSTALTHWNTSIGYGHNLMLNYNDASFEESIGNWNVTNGTLTRSTYAGTLFDLGTAITIPVPYLFDKDYPLRPVALGVVTASSTSDITLSCPGTSSSAVLYGIPVVAGTKYMFKGWIRGISDSYTAVAKVQWFDASGTSISTSSAGPTVTAGVGFWSEFKSISTTVESGVVAPSNAFYAKPILIITPTAGGNKFAIDMFEFRALPSTNIVFSGKLPALTYEDARLVKVNVNLDLENLIPNPGFDLGTGGWFPYNAEVIQEKAAPSTAVVFGGSVAKLTALSDGRVGLVSDWISVTPGAPHSFAIYASGSAKPTVARIEFSAPQSEEEQAAVLVDEEGRFFKKEPYYYDSEPITLTATAQRVGVSAVASVKTPDYGTPLCKVSVYIDNAVVGDVFYLDAAILTKSTEIKDYFQGNGGPIPVDPNLNQYYDSNDCFWEKRNQLNMVSISSLENTNKWTEATGTTKALESSIKLYGTTSMRLSATGGGAATTTVKLPMGAADGGEDIVISSYIYGPAGLYSISTNGQKVGNFKTTAANTWTRIQTERLPLAGETQFDITIGLSEAGSGTKVFYIDGVQAEYGRIPTPYVDPAAVTTFVISNPSDSAETISVANNSMVSSGQSYYANRYRQKDARLAATLSSVMPAGATWSINTPNTLIGFSEVKTNLIISGSFENSLAGWSGISSSLVRVIARGSIFDEILVQGAAYGRVKASSSGTFGITTDYITTPAGKGYYLSAAVRPENEDSYGVYTLTLDWYDTAKNYLRSKTNIVTISRGDRWAYLDVVAPGSKKVLIESANIASNVLTVTTVGNHGFSIGEELYVSLTNESFSAFAGNILITAVGTNTISWTAVSPNIVETSTTGTATFVNTSVGFAKIKVECTPSVSGTGRVFHLDKVLFRE
jgi:hypothetical protein